MLVTALCLSVILCFALVVGICFVLKCNGLATLQLGELESKRLVAESQIALLRQELEHERSK